MRGRSRSAQNCVQAPSPDLHRFACKSSSPRARGEEKGISFPRRAPRPSLAEAKRRVGKGAKRRAHVLLTSLIRVGFACAQPTLQLASGSARDPEKLALGLDPRVLLRFSDQITHKNREAERRKAHC
jgi:hypothetical protein